MIVTAALDARVKCCVSYLGVSSGREWLHSMRREYEWIDYLKSIEADRKQRAATGKGAAKKGERTRLWGVPEVG